MTYDIDPYEGRTLTLGSLQQVVVTVLRSPGLEFQFVLFDKLLDAWQSKHVHEACGLVSASDLLGSYEELHRDSLRTRCRGRSFTELSRAASVLSVEVFLSLRKRYAAASSAFRGRVELFNCPGLPEPRGGAVAVIGCSSLEVVWSRPRSSWSSTTATAFPRSGVLTCLQMPQGTGYSLHLWKALWSRQDNLHVLHACKLAARAKHFFICDHVRAGQEATI